MKNKRMDNGGFRDVEEGTELGLVQSNKKAAATPEVSSTSKSTPKSIQKYPVGNIPKVPSSAGPSKPSRIVCRTEVCRAAKKTFLPPDLTDGPWNNFKAIAFCVLIVLFIIWIVVYVILRHLKIV